MSESNRQYLITLDNLAAFKEDISESIDALDAVKILNLQDVEGVSNSLAQIDNAVYSESSIALGKKNKVGSWGYKIQEFTFNENGEIIIKTNTNHGLTEAIKGKAISIIYRKEFVFTNCGTISSFTNDTIVIAPNAAVEYPTEPPSDGIDAYLKFVEYPNLGTIRLDTEGAMAIGYETLATDYGAVSGGNKSTADGAGSISVGINNFTGYGASSFGGQNKSMARYSSTENFNNAVYAEKAHAEGSNNIIGKTAISAHVEGHQNKVRKDISSYHLNNAGEILPTANHVEGYSNIDNGIYSHIEGQSCEISAGVYRAHAGGQGVQIGSAGHDSFGHGRHLKINKQAQAVFGVFNEPDTNALFIIGDGEGDVNRSNAFSIIKNTNKEVTGYIGAKTNDNKIITQKTMTDELDALNTEITKISNDIAKDYQSKVTGTYGQFVVIGQNGLLTTMTIEKDQSYPVGG